MLIQGLAQIGFYNGLPTDISFLCKGIQFLKHIKAKVHVMRGCPDSLNLRKTDFSARGFFKLFTFNSM